MRLIIAGSNAELKNAIAAKTSSETGIKWMETQDGAVAKRVGIENDLEGYPVEKRIEFLDAMLQDHTNKLRSVNEGIFTVSALDILAYYMFWCSRHNDDEFSRTIYTSCLEFLKNYDKIFIFRLTNNNYVDDTNFILGGRIVYEYAIELIIRGLLERWDVNYFGMDCKDIDSCVAEVILRSNALNF